MKNKIGQKKVFNDLLGSLLRNIPEVTFSNLNNLWSKPTITIAVNINVSI